MTAISPAGLERFLGSEWRSYPVVLVHGSDEGLIRETARRLVTLAAGPDADPLSNVVLEGDSLAADPGRLADEMGAIGLFGGTRTIHVRPAQRLAPALVEAAIAAGGGQARLILEAGELRGGTALRTFAEKAPNVAAIACYADDIKALSRLVDGVLADSGLRIEPEARSLLIGALGNDRSLSRGEVEKLCLYAGSEETVTVAMVEAIVSDAGRHEISSVIDPTFAGDISVIESEANRLFAAGTSPAAVLSQAISHALLLRRGLAAGGVEATMRLGRFHFSRKPAVGKALNLWSESRLDRAVSTLSTAVLQSRRLPRLAEVVGVRTLWALSRLATNRAN